MDNQNKPFGFWILTSLVVGNMIGSGIFLLPANLAKLGQGSIIPWLITICGVFALAIVLAKMSILVPKHGGPFAYAKVCLGDFPGFQTVCSHWIAILIANLGILLALILYLTAFFPSLAKPYTAFITSIIILWLLAFFNTTKINYIGRFQLLTTILKLLPILGLIIFGIWYVNPAHFNAITNSGSLNYSAISNAASLTIWAFIGVESATIPYNYVENPEKNIPLATLVGTIIAIIIYIASSTVVIGILPPEILLSSSSPFVAAATMIFGIWGKWIMLAGAVISCLGCMNGWIFLQNQVAMIAADNNLFPSYFSIRNNAGLPVFSIVITTLLQTIILIVALHNDILNLFHLMILTAALAALIPYLYTSVAALVALKQPAVKNLPQTKTYFIIACIAAIYIFWAILISSYKVLLFGSLLLLLSTIFYGLIYKPNDDKT